LRFKPIAKGAAAYTKIGFGIELPLAESYIDAAKVMGCNLVFRILSQTVCIIYYKVIQVIITGIRPLVFEMILMM